MGMEPDDPNAPRRGSRSGREFLAVMFAAVLTSSLCSVFFAVMAGWTALLASFAVGCVGTSGALWWQFRGRQRFPLKKPPRVSLLSARRSSDTERLVRFVSQ